MHDQEAGLLWAESKTWYKSCSCWDKMFSDRDRWAYKRSNEKEVSGYPPVEGSWIAERAGISLPPRRNIESDLVRGFGIYSMPIFAQLFRTRG